MGFHLPRSSCTQRRVTVSQGGRKYNRRCWNKDTWLRKPEVGVGQGELGFLLWPI